MGWYCGNSDRHTHPVAQKHTNAWGLYDMHGNVLEWCQDWYGDYPLGTEPDPLGPKSGSGRVSEGVPGSAAPRPAARRHALVGRPNPAVTSLASAWLGKFNLNRKGRILVPPTLDSCPTLNNRFVKMEATRKNHNL